MRNIFKTHTAIASLCLMTHMSYAEVMVIDDTHYVRTDRYTLTSLDIKQEQLSPMLSVIEIDFSPNITTVAHGIKELLIGSGYTWNINNPDNDMLNTLPLPAIVQSLGPMRLQDALITLAGRGWDLQVNHFSRTIWFQRIEFGGIQ